MPLFQTLNSPGKRPSLGKGKLSIIVVILSVFFENSVFDPEHLPDFHSILTRCNKLWGGFFIPVNTRNTSHGGSLFG
jgi:hypothetical protein